MKHGMKHSPSLLAKSNLLAALKTSFSILNSFISQEKQNSLNIEQSSLFLPPLTPVLPELSFHHSQFTLNTYEEYESNQAIAQTHQQVNSKMILKSVVSAVKANKEVKEMPLLSEKAKLQNIFIKKMAHVQEKSNGSILMNRSNMKSSESLVKEEKEEMVDVGNISILLEKNLTRNFTPDKANKKDHNTPNEKLNLTPTNARGAKGIGQSQMMNTQLTKQSQMKRTQAKKAAKVPQVEFTINFEELKKRTNEMKAKNVGILCKKK